MEEGTMKMSEMLDSLGIQWGTDPSGTLYLGEVIPNVYIMLDYYDDTYRLGFYHIDESGEPDQESFEDIQVKNLANMKNIIKAIMATYLEIEEGKED